MRILHFLPSLSAEAGGPARATPDLCRTLAAAGHTVTLVSAKLGDVASEWDRLPKVHGLRLIQAPPPRLPAFTYLPSQLGFFKELIAQHEVLHVHGLWEYANIQLSRLAVAAHKPYVVSLRGMLGSWPMRQSPLRKRIFLNLAGRRWITAANGIHFTARAELEHASKWIPVERGIVIPNLLDLEPYRTPPSPEQAQTRLQLPSRERPRILFLGRIHPVKGLDILLHAAALLRRAGRPISLIVAGDGEPAYVAEMKALTGRLEIAEDVMFVGMVTGALKLSLFQACDVLAVPSHHENFGFVFVEALACGLPVVTTPQVAIHADLQASGAAAIVERSPQGFADAIAAAVRENHSVVQVRDNGRRWVFEWLAPETLVARFISLYGAPRQAATPRVADVD